MVDVLNSEFRESKLIRRKDEFIVYKCNSPFVDLIK
jgi:hypothetical protein